MHAMASLLVSVVTPTVRASSGQKRKCVRLKRRGTTLKFILLSMSIKL